MAVILGIGTVLTQNLALIIPVISRSGPFGQLPFDSVIPLVVVIVIGTSQAAATTPVTSVSVRNYETLLLVLLLSFSGLFIAVHAVASLVLYNELRPDVARNMIVNLTLVVAATRFVGAQRALILPVLYVFISSVFGRSNGEIQPWALPIQRASLAEVIVGGFILLVLVIYTIYRSSRAK